MFSLPNPFKRGAHAEPEDERKARDALTETGDELALEVSTNVQSTVEAANELERTVRELLERNDALRRDRHARPH